MTIIKKDKLGLILLDFYMNRLWYEDLSVCKMIEETLKTSYFIYFVDDCN